jgi:tetraacyldisaccharide 4'-kinase
LLPAAAIYGAISAIRNCIAIPYTSNIPVICIGNVTVGGAGKTPTSILIARTLQDMGHKPVFLSRGFGGKLSGVLVDEKIHSSSDVGDEPLLLAKIAPVIVSRDRKMGAKLAENIGDVIIMDDGLQNPTIHKTRSFLVIDGTYGIGNGQILPAGPLREKFKSALKKVSAVVLIGEDKHNISSAIGDKTIIRATIVSLEKNTTDKSYIAFAGIGNPDKFFNTLKENNYKLIETIAFPDHYPYTKNDIAKLKEKAKNLKGELITTEKDFVRIAPELCDNINTLPVNLVVEDVNLIKNILKNDA